MVTSCLWEKRSFTGSGFPLKNSPCARKYRSISSSTSSSAATTIRFIVAPPLALISPGLYRAFARKRETGHHASVVRVGSRSHHWLCLVPHRVPRSSWGGLLGLYPYWPF